MIKSMTGYGKAHFESGKKSVTIGVKSLNSKNLDFYYKAPPIYREKELEIRNLISSHMSRGKVELSIQVSTSGKESNLIIDKDLFRQYYRDMKSLTEEFGATTDVIPIISKFPDVFQSSEEGLDEMEWRLLEDAIIKALKELDEFRVKEGEVLLQDLEKRIKLILENLDRIMEMEGERVVSFRKRITMNLSEHLGADKVNADRFEQEMIYYLEKLDITEEKIRLKSHCDYFLETVQLETSSGKKLGFISQEIGREINTIGSKANHAEIQKMVVQMKDELEKIKEQLLNVL